ncbi:MULTISPECIES: ATP-binding protein [unclassified Endozoicomonas]|uniref:ATP-binding protein n=1 Tax=unclassified Endozoicomonas TaxID=2644528 RepID=UPI00214899FE|nr:MULTISPECIES: ATP-binding protein [unclassified Endozoicomonas]
MSQVLKLEIDSQLSNTRLVAMAVRGVCAMTTLSPVEINRLELCLVEIVNNAIEHAYDNEAGHPVEVCVSMDKTTMNISVSDWGQSIPDDVMQNKTEMVVDPEQPEVWLCSGRGLHIVNKLMDQVTYESNQDKNSFIMKKELRH